MAQQQMAYNPYAPQGAAGPQNPYGSGAGQNPFGQQQQEAKSYSIPTWLFVLIIIGFLGVAAALWFLL